MDDSREKLAAQVFDSIGDMVRGYAQEAVRVAQRQFGVRLDFTPHSIEALERLLEGQAAFDLDFQSRLWGSYFGEVMRFRWNGEWLLAQYPGGQAAVPTLEVSGSRLYPTMKVYRRLTLGPAESVLTFYQMVAGRLEASGDASGRASESARGEE